MLHWLEGYNPLAVFVGALIYTILVGALLLIVRANLWLWVILLPGPIVMGAAIDMW